MKKEPTGSLSLGAVKCTGASFFIKIRSGSQCRGPLSNKHSKSGLDVASLTQGHMDDKLSNSGISYSGGIIFNHLTRTDAIYSLAIAIFFPSSYSLTFFTIATVFYSFQCYSQMGFHGLLHLYSLSSALQ